MKRIRKVNKDGMRKNNTSLIFEAIYRNPGITRTSLATDTKMSAMAVGRIVDFLLKSEMAVEKQSETTYEVGRPASQLFVNDNIRTIGVSLDADGAFIGLTDPYGKLLAFDLNRFATEGRRPEEVLGAVADLVRDFSGKNAAGEDMAVGIVVPGLVDNKTATIRFSSQLKWRDVDVSPIWSGHSAQKVIIDNDIKARALAESMFGASRPYGRSVLLNVGSGVGAGIIIDGEIYRGRENLAGEIGHTVIGLNNRMCQCGRKGCLEATISLPAVLREARNIDPNIDMTWLVKAYYNNEYWAKTLLEMIAEQILMLIDMLANAYAPDVIVLCGSLIDKCKALGDIIKLAHKELLSNKLNTEYSLEFSEFGPNGNIIGAAVSAFNYNMSKIIEGS